MNIVLKLLCFECRICQWEGVNDQDAPGLECIFNKFHRNTDEIEYNSEEDYCEYNRWEERSTLGKETVWGDWIMRFGLCMISLNEVQQAFEK